MAIELDISKAYDKLEWSFLKEMMKKLGFNNLWISMIMTCVTIVGYATLIKGQPNSIIKLSTGTHQEDLISPYLYLIYVKVLSPLLNEVEQSNIISRVNVARGNQTINHLFFKDNSIVLCKANSIE